MVFNPLRVSQRGLIPLLMALFLMLFGQLPAQAQDQSSQTPDLQQMQKKMEQLEKEMQELRQQINPSLTLEASRAGTKRNSADYRHPPGRGTRGATKAVKFGRLLRLCDARQWLQFRLHQSRLV